MRIYLEPKLCDAIWPAMQKMGALAGGPLDSLAHDADHHPPVLSHRERNGHNKQRIDKHPAYRAMEKIAFGEFGLAAMNHRAGIMGADASWPPIAKYLLSYLFVQSEFGLCCPLSMTDSLTRTLSRFGSPELVNRYLEISLRDGRGTPCVPELFFGDRVLIYQRPCRAPRAPSFRGHQTSPRCTQVLPPRRGILPRQ